MKPFEGSDPFGFIDRGKSYTLVSFRARTLNALHSERRQAYPRSVPIPLFNGAGRADPLSTRVERGPSDSLYFLLEGVAEAALYCAHRTSTFLSCAFCEQEGHLAVPSSSHFRAPWKGCRGRRRSERPHASSILVGDI